MQTLVAGLSERPHASIPSARALRASVRHFMRARAWSAECSNLGRLYLMPGALLMAVMRGALHGSWRQGHSSRLQIHDEGSLSLKPEELNGKKCTRQKL
jgi:hypothetical protein